MSAEYDATEFVDNDFQNSHKAAFTGSVSPAPAPAARAPSREEVDSKVGETQQKLAELKRIQEELERERAGLEETRRRQIEFENGRREAIENLTRAVGLLTEAEFSHRREAEQMTKSLADIQIALAKVEATNEQSWTKENFTAELSRALTVIENARMEWNSARLKFAVLSGAAANESPASANESRSPSPFAPGQSLGQLCKLGLALTWPLAVVALLVGLLLVFVRH